VSQDRLDQRTDAMSAPTHEGVDWLGTRLRLSPASEISASPGTPESLDDVFRGPPIAEHDHREPEQAERVRFVEGRHRLRRSVRARSGRRVRVISFTSVVGE
jgi:hypothetical protein